MGDLFEEKNISPMLLSEVKQPFDSEEYIYELKLDGIRCIAYLSPYSVNLRNKRNKELINVYPELKKANECVRTQCILDGELVVLSNGKPDFYSLQERSLMANPLKIELASKRKPVSFVAYDILYYNGRDITGLQQTERKKILADNVKEGNGISVSRWIEKHGVAFFELTKQQGLEGVVAKKKNGIYKIGKRASEWIKIKVMQEEDLLVVGYVPDNDGNVKDLILASQENSIYTNRGKVYLGVSEQERKLIRKSAKLHKTKTPYFPDTKNAIWLKNPLKGTVVYMHKTESGALRQPVWKGLKE